MESKSELPVVPEKYRYAILPVVFLLYLLAAELGHLLSFPGDFATFWPPAGFALAAFLVVPRKRWVLVLLGTFLGNLASDVALHDKTVWVSFGFWIANSLEVLVAVGMINLYLRSGELLSTPLRIFQFVLLPCLVGTAVGATFGAGVVSYAFGPAYNDTWRIWWSGDFIGMLVTFPCIWMIAESRTLAGMERLQTKFASGARFAEFFLAIVIVGVVSAYIFGFQNQRLAYAVYPALLILSMRFSLVGATFGLLTMALVTIAFTADGHGLFGEIADVPERASVLQIFLFVGATTFLTLAASNRSRTLAQKSQAETQRMLLTATQGGDVGLWDWVIGTNEVRWSDQCHHQLGETPGALSDFADWEQRVHPDDLEQSLKNVEASMSRPDGNYESTFRLRHVSGTYRWILSRGLIERDAEGNPIRMSGSHIDITELKSVRDQLESYLNLLGATDAGWNWDIGTDQVDYSPRFREMIGFDFDDEEGFPPTFAALKERVHTEDLGQLLDQIDEHLEDDSPFQCEFRMRLKTDQYRWFRARGRAMRDADGKATRMAGSVYDITDRKIAELELKASNSDLAQFAYVASHDLQEPLRAVIGFCQLLEKRCGDQLDKKATEYMTHIVEGATRMKSLIDDLLKFSRVGQGDADTRPTDLNRVVASATDSLRALIEESDVEVHVGDLPTIDGHPGLLEQLFQNLIANGIKFQKPGVRPKIHISSRVTGNMIELAVKDNGIGILPEHKERIFVLFERLHHRSEYPGTGIGLAICKRIVDRHWGKLDVESDAKHGSRFVITLPMKASRSKGAGELMALPHTHMSSKR